MSNLADAYEYAYNGADCLYVDSFWTAVTEAGVTQAGEAELAKLVAAFRTVGLEQQAVLLSTYLETDARALEKWIDHGPHDIPFEPSRDWDAEFAAILGPEGYAGVQKTIEQFRISHGLDKL